MGQDFQFDSYIFQEGLKAPTRSNDGTFKVMALLSTAYQGGKKPPLFLTPFFDHFLLRLQKFDHADFQGEYVAYTPTQVAERAEWDLGGGVFLG